MRCVTKGGSFYNNASWDLVDACRQKVVKLEDLKEEELSEELRAIPRGERAAYIEAKGARRAELQARIAKVNQERIAFLAEEEKKETGDEEKTLDRAILECVRQQAELKEFRFE